MSRKFNVYVRGNGNRVAVFDRPVAGQLRFTARKRTALDGRVWWHIFDNEEDRCIPSKFHTRKNCEADIASRLRHKTLEFVPFKDGKFNNGVRKFAVDVTWEVFKVYEVDATSRKDAQKKVQEMVDSGEVCVWTDGFETGDKVEVRTVGEEKNGDIKYYI